MIIPMTSLQRANTVRLLLAEIHNDIASEEGERADLLGSLAVVAGSLAGIAELIADEAEVAGGFSGEHTAIAANKAASRLRDGHAALSAASNAAK